MTPELTDADREAIATAMRECAATHPTTHKEGYAAACTACYLAGRATERERCAKLIDSKDYGAHEDLAAAIRESKPTAPAQSPER